MAEMAETAETTEKVESTKMALSQSHQSGGNACSFLPNSAAVAAMDGDSYSRPLEQTSKRKAWKR